jgi:hypothetical protein
MSACYKVAYTWHATYILINHSSTDTYGFVSACYKVAYT